MIRIGALVYPGMDQLDFTGPFEVLVRMDDAECCLIWKNLEPIRDVAGLAFLPDTRLEDAPALDVLVVPGGPGQEALMHDESVLAFVRSAGTSARFVLSVCTGALLCGAAGLLHGKRATTHWASIHLLQHFGARTTDERVVVDGNFVSSAGVTSGIDAALQVAALAQGQAVAERIALAIEYAPEPPFGHGTPRHSRPEIVAAVTEALAPIVTAREKTAHAYRNLPRGLG
ncbi:MAG TPA: DJ-1/PfpI family protein [Candidatus Acidoferrales bacterium]|jgi:cyclohexyl-isocyanide hydratase|nr:DJ-1/PfpI family protein [Candidatus Acidoferrales bacterium]